MCPGSKDIWAPLSGRCHATLLPRIYAGVREGSHLIQIDREKHGKAALRACLGGSLALFLVDVSCAASNQNSTDPVARQSEQMSPTDSSARQSEQMSPTNSLVEVSPDLTVGETLDWERIDSLGRPGWVEVRAAVLSSGSETPDAAALRARRRARRMAVEFVAGVQIESSTILLDRLAGADAESLLETLTRTRADGLVVDERISEELMVPLAGGVGFLFRVVMQAQVLDRSASLDPGFEIALDMDATRIFVGEPIEVRIRSTRAARLYGLNLTPEGVRIVFPSRFLPQTAIGRGESLIFPPRPDAGSAVAPGVEIVGQLPPGQRRAQEILLVIAIRGDHDPLASALSSSPHTAEGLRGVEPGEAGRMISDYLAPLAALAPDLWAFDQIAFEIVGR